MADADRPEVVQPDDDESCKQGECMPWDEGITRYSVTDLVLHSAEDLTTLAAALEDRGMRVTQRALQIAEEAREWFRIDADKGMWIFQGGFCGKSFAGPETEIAAMLAKAPSDAAICHWEFDKIGALWGTGP